MKFDTDATSLYLAGVRIGPSPLIDRVETEEPKYVGRQPGETYFVREQAGNADVWPEKRHWKD
jgi:hypothetical protein